MLARRSAFLGPNLPEPSPIPCHGIHATLTPAAHDGACTQSLVEGQGGDPDTGGLAGWQRELIAHKLGLAAGAGGRGGADGGAESIRVYLSGVAAEAAPKAAVAAEAPAVAGSAAAALDDTPAVATPTGSGPVAAGPVRQPVDPRLLAALRIGTLQVRAHPRRSCLPFRPIQLTSPGLH